MGWIQPAQFTFSPWIGCNQPIILFSVGWMQPAHVSFLRGLDATSPFFFSPWAGCNQPVFLFSMGWMKPVHFFWASIFDSWHTTSHHDCSIIADLFETQDNLHVQFLWLFNYIMIAILACTSIQGSAMPQSGAPAASACFAAVAAAAQQWWQPHSCCSQVTLKNIMMQGQAC